MRCSTIALLAAIGAMLPLAAAAHTSAPATPAAAPSPAASGSAHTARGTATRHMRNGSTAGYGRSTIIVPPEAVNRALDAYDGSPTPHRAAPNAQRRPTPKPSGGEEVFSTVKNGN